MDCFAACRNMMIRLVKAYSEFGKGEPSIGSQATCNQDLLLHRPS
jgi:hypothetical protein